MRLLADIYFILERCLADILSLGYSFTNNGVLRLDFSDDTRNNLACVDANPAFHALSIFQEEALHIIQNFHCKICNSH